MKKNSRVRRLLAVILCMTLVLSSNIVSMAAEENGTEVQELTETPVIEETEPVVADEPVPEDITETETPVTETPETVPTEKPTEEPVDTEVPTETVTEPETPETPAQDETEKPAEMGTPAAPEAPGAQEEPGTGDQSVEVVGYIYIESTDDEYPPYLTADDMGTSGSKYTAHNATIKGEVSDWDAPGYKKNSDGTFECLHIETLGERHKHYAVLKYSNEGSEISYIRCDLFDGEDPKFDYYAVFFKDAKTNKSIIAGEGEIFEIVKKGDIATRIPLDKTNGYWTLGKTVKTSIQNEEQLAKIEDSGVLVNPRTHKINEQTVFIWHETAPVFYIDTEGNSLIENNEHFWEDVEIDKTPKNVPNKTKGYWTVGQYDNGSITTKEQLKAVTDPNPTIKLTTDEIKQQSISKQTIFIWHDIYTLKFTKIAEDTNQPLSGVTFQLIKGTESKPATSTKDGLVKFTDLEVGEYILTETSTLENYMLPTNSWNVNVATDGKVTITGGDDGLLEGDTSEGYRIINKIRDQLRCNKTVSVVNENERTFEILLTADSKLNTQKETNKIVDVIDSRFKLVSGERERLERKYSDKISFENGDLKITWTGNAAIIKPDPDPNNPDDHGWKETIKIQAKDNFMGGNMIPTNGSNSGIYVDADEKIDLEFQKPTVNVKLLGITAEDKEETVFLGDMIYATQFPQKLLDKIKINEIPINNFDLPSTCLPKEEDMISLVDGTIVTKDYSYGNTSDKVGTFTYQFKPVKPEGLKVNDHEATIKDDETEQYVVEQYQLTITYKALDVQERKSVLGGKSDSYLEPVGEEQKIVSTATGTYTVKVIAGEIQITKKITSDFQPQLEGDPIFTFRIDKTDENNRIEKTWYRTVRFNDNNVKELSVESLSNLERGKYTVTELKSQRYSLNSIDTRKSTCDVIRDTNSVTFEIGVSGTQDNKGDKGIVTFVNEKKIDDNGKQTDTDVRVNRFTRDSDGKWTWEGHTIPPEQKKDSKQ